MFSEMRSHVVLLAVFSAITIPIVYLVPFPYALLLAIAACICTAASLLLLRWAGLWKSRQRWLSGSIILSYTLLVLFYLVLSILAAIATWPTMALGLAMPIGLLLTFLIEAKAPTHAIWVSRLAVGLGLMCWYGIVLIGGGKLFVAVGFAPSIASVLCFIVYANSREAVRSFRRRQRG